LHGGVRRPENEAGEREVDGKRKPFREEPSLGELRRRFKKRYSAKEED